MVKTRPRYHCLGGLLTYWIHTSTILGLSLSTESDDVYDVIATSSISSPEVVVVAAAAVVVVVVLVVALLVLTVAVLL